MRYPSLQFPSIRSGTGQRRCIQGLRYRSPKSRLQDFVPHCSTRRNPHSLQQGTNTSSKTQLQPQQNKPPPTNLATRLPITKNAPRGTICPSASRSPALPLYLESEKTSLINRHQNHPGASMLSPDRHPKQRPFLLRASTCALLIAAATSLARAQSAQLSIDATKIVSPVSPTLYGLMTEE